MIRQLMTVLLALTVGLATPVLAQENAAPKPVTPENYVVAETDWNFAGQQAQAAINTWTHNDQVTKDNQTIIRSNADVVYSLALVDVSEGATLSIPKRENGALQMIHYMDENHLTHGVIYAGESVTVTPGDLTGGEYIYILARTQISDDMAETRAAQQSMVIDAKSARPYQSKGFAAAEVEAFREKLIAEVYSGEAFGDDVLDASRAFGATFDDVDNKDYYYAAAVGWGGLPPQHAQYTAFVKGQGSAANCQTITFPKPNLDYENGGFFSLTTYNAESWIAEDNFYIGHKRMLDNGDGTMTIDFNCDTPHSVTVSEGWNGTFRLYRPMVVNETIDLVNHLMTIDIEMKAEPTGGTEMINSRFGKLAFENGFTTGYPTHATAKALFNEMHFQRANQAYIWSIPIVSMYEWKNSLERMGSEDGRIVYLEGYEPKLGGLTYNTSTPYALTFVNIEREPLVVDIPTDKIRGAAHNMWQIGLEQMTTPGTYVFIAKGSEAPANIPESAKVIVSNTNYIFVGLRLMADTREARLKNLGDITFKRLDGSHVSGKAPVFPEKGDDAKHPRGMNFWKVLNQAIQSEPIHERDRIMHDMLRPLGIEKGKAFAPDAMQKAILDEAVVTGEAMVKNIDFNKDQYLPHAHYGGEGVMWDVATVSTPNQDRDGGMDLDGRAAWFYEAVTNDVAMHGLENGGWGQVYLDCYKDSNGSFLDGGKRYTLDIPADANYADLFWTITAYNAENRAIIANETKRADVGSNVEGTVANEDGLFTFHFAPEKPGGVSDANWIQTNKGEGWFVYFRAYSPTKEFVEQEPGTIVPNFELVQ